VPEDRGVVDDHDTRPAAYLDPAVDPGWRDVDDGDVDAVEELLGQRLDDQPPGHRW
jgi:hypothetical protein